jgi:predicted RND superfamily exporter protein
MWNALANFILKFRFLVLGVITLVTVFLGYFAVTNLKMENKYGILLPKDSPTTKNYNEFKSHFGEDGGVFVIALKTDSLYTTENFRNWKKLGEEILKEDGVESVISEATLMSFVKDKKSRKKQPKKITEETLSKRSIEQIRKDIKNNPFYNKILYNDSTHVSLMMVKISENSLSDIKSPVIFDIQKLAEKYVGNIGEIHYAGLPYLRVVLAHRIQSEMYIFIALSMLVSALLMYLFFKSFRAVLICMSVVGVSVVQAMGTIAIMGYHVSVMMALIPPLMIVIGIPNCIYLYNKYHQELALHGNRAKALNRVVSKTGIAMFLTNVTTALGFFTFLFTNSDKFFEFGVISTLNIMMCYVVSLCLIPIFASFLRSTPQRHLKHLDRKLAVGLLNKLVYITAKKRPWVYVVTIILTVIFSIGMFKMKVTGNITGDIPESDPISKDIKFMEASFGGAVPFEIMIDYKEKNRWHKIKTLEKIEEVQKQLAKDPDFSKSVSIVDVVKFLNMSYYNNDPKKFKIYSARDRKKLDDYRKELELQKEISDNGTFSIKDLVDTSQHILRVRLQVKDLVAYEISEKVNKAKAIIDSVMNPRRNEIEKFYAKVIGGETAYIDSIISNNPKIYNALTAEIAQKNRQLQDKLDSIPKLLKTYYNKPDFNNKLRKAIDLEYFDTTITGTSVVVSEGTQYLVWNLIYSILFAVVSIAALMSLLFSSIRMVIISMIPNLIPMIITAGIMGWFNIPLKPSTLLIFSIALGITVDNTIHFLARYRQELSYKRWDLKDCIAISIQETGLSIIYTSVILFFGFIVFVFSDFGGTQALGYLSAITYFVALFTNLVLLPCLLMTLERRITTKSFEEPFFELYDEELDFDLFQLEVKEEENPKIDNSDINKPDITKE